MQFMKAVVETVKQPPNYSKFEYSKQVYEPKTAYRHPEDFYSLTDAMGVPDGNTYRFDCYNRVSDDGKQEGGCDRIVVNTEGNEMEEDNRKVSEW